MKFLQPFLAAWIVTPCLIPLFGGMPAENKSAVSHSHPQPALTATRAAAPETRLSHRVSSSGRSETHANRSRASASGTWNHQGVVIAPSDTDANTVLEPTVIYEGSPQLLTNYKKVFKMWFDAGWGDAAGNIWYAESPDGVDWTRDSGPCVTGHYRTHVHKDGLTYYMFTANIAQTQYDLYTSANGRIFTLNTPAVLRSGSGWDGNIENMSVFVEKHKWYMLYDGYDSATGTFSIGLASAPAAAGTWSKSSANPVIRLEHGSVTGPSEVIKIGAVYYVWLQRAPSSTLPTDIYSYHSSDLTEWKPNPSSPAFARTTWDEGADSSIGQVADPSIIEVGGKSLLFYSASTDGRQASGRLQIKLATADMPISRLVRTNQGVNHKNAGTRLEAFPGHFVTAAFANGWTSYDDSQPPRCSLQSREVVCKGAIKNGSIGRSAFTLPRDWRPQSALTFCHSRLSRFEDDGSRQSGWNHCADLGQQHTDFPGHCSLCRRKVS
ncbi:MAG TPA: hypothetical protein VGQ46_07420 [Thermoanaerobaculia bacterium]|jgi:hypothetical protein|nr:hypothetical protein [Thermoanaerobaculia bacterium]